MAVDPKPQRELVLAPNEFAHVQDQTKGEITTYVGPFTATLSNNDVPVVFHLNTKRFDPVEDQSQGKQVFVTAPAGWYVLLQNPAKDNKHPRAGMKNSSTDEMEIGTKIVVPGPCNFALWPGQIAKVIQGHRLRSNEYLVIEVYDQDAARETWRDSVVKAVDTETLPDEKGSTEPAPKAPVDVKDSPLFSSIPSDLANGRQYIVRGNVYSFFIPPTGVKVVPDEKNGNAYIRQAITLEKLEYAVLLDEDGQKEFIYGPAVVFPKPTQHFVTKDVGGIILYKFRAYELDARSGIYIKVIEDYTDTDPVTKTERVFNAGEELFVTGDGQIYFPRKEHSIIRYGTQEVHYAIAIPKGEGRYVLNRESGDVTLIIGPRMFLPDPRKEVVTRRILSDKEVQLLYPGNDEALLVNRTFRQNLTGQGTTGLESTTADVTAPRTGIAVRRMAAAPAADVFAGDSFERRTGFTPPRTVILDTKYEGAVTVVVWTGYAVKVVDKKGQSRVVKGPSTLLLEYDEILEALSLSTGKPKNADRLINTVYLRITGNLVSDIVDVMTKDMDTVSIKLSYRVNFEGEDTNRWFSVENYVKWLCDHARSRLKAAIRKIGTVEFNNRATEIVRDVILGASPGEGKEREGMRFAENGMRVYDVEVLEVSFTDSDLENLLQSAQRDALRQSLDLEAMQRKLRLAEEKTVVAQKELAANRTLEEAQHTATLERAAAKYTEDEQKFTDANALEAAKLAVQREREEIAQNHREALRQASLDDDTVAAEKERGIADERRSISTADTEAELEQQRKAAEIAEQATKVRVEAAAKIAEAFNPQLVQALNALTDTEVLKVLADKFGDLGILEGRSMLAVAERFLGVFPKNLVPVIERLQKTDVPSLTREIDPTKKQD